LLGRKGPVAPGPGDRGIFEIFKNGHIFLKFLFFLNIKNKKKASPTHPSEKLLNST